MTILVNLIILVNWVNIVILKASVLRIGLKWTNFAQLPPT